MANGKWALGALIGAAAAFVSGVLLAPKSGKETRDDIKTEIDKDVKKVKSTAVREAELLKLKATKIVGDVSEKAKDVSEDVTSKAKEVKGHFDKAVEGSQKTLSTKPAPKKK